MVKNIDKVLNAIEEDYQHILSPGSRHYLEVDIGQKAQQMGYGDIGEKFKNTYAIVPLEHPVRGMKVMIDGRTFVRYGQFESGVAVPGYVAKETRLPVKKFVPDHSMILNFA